MKHIFRSTVFVLAAIAGALSGVSAQSDYRLRPDDVLNISVLNQADLTKKYTVERDGTLIFPLIGRVPAAGRTTEELQVDLERRLAAGFLAEPKIQVALERARRVFVFGGVTSPGMYQLTENMTLIELLARAGYGNAAEVLIIRNKDARAPALPAADADGQVIRVSLREFERDIESGELSRNVVLEEGDTVYVPRGDPNRIYVSGQVRNPGAYSIPEGTTLLQALTLAGGPTERAALGRIRIIRLVNGKQERISGELGNAVRPGDTIVVPERFF
jgi:polysaccharide export outer membrane protein